MKIYIERSIRTRMPKKEDYSIIDENDLTFRSSGATYAGTGSYIIAILDGDDIIPRSNESYLRKSDIIKIINENIPLFSVKERLLNKINTLKTAWEELEDKWG